MRDVKFVVTLSISEDQSDVITEIDRRLSVMEGPELSEEALDKRYKGELTEAFLELLEDSDVVILDIEAV